MAWNQATESKNQQSISALTSEPAHHYTEAMNNYIVEELDRVLCLPIETLLSDETHVDSRSICDISLQNPVNGDAHWDGKQVIFIPDSGYFGPASFEYSVMDEQGYIDSATVNLSLLQT